MFADRTTTRRDFLRTAAAGAAGLAVTGGLPAASRPPLGTAKSCIFINLVGGPSHLDTFDPKPDAPLEYRGPFRPIQTNVPGLHLSELFPKMAAMADRFALVRSMHHDAPPIHECGFQLLNTGRLFRDGPEWPSVGAVVNRLTDRPSAILAASDEIRTGISISHGQGNGWLSQSPVSGLIVYPESEIGELLSEAAEWVQHRYGFITVNMFPTVFDSPSWDCHADRGSLRCDLNDYRETVAPAFDTAFAALLTDLEDRGLLDTTLVVATGEFGRTPLLNANGGRDHWAGCWTAIVAGGGVKGGRVIGASDPHGIEPKDRPVMPQELVATIFHALGVPQTATIPGPDGSPVAVYPGRSVTELF
jgi:uncharacterized protein (DUF1501 family)